MYETDMYLIYTIGFDEKYILRSLSEKKIYGNTKITIVAAEPLVEKTKAALNMASMTIEKIYGIVPHILTVDLENFYHAVKKVKVLFENIPPGEQIFLSISGGFRILGLVVLTAALQSSRIFSIEVLREDMEKIYQIPSSVFERPKLDDIDLKILKVLETNGLVTGGWISKQIGISRVTVWRRLEKLREKGLVVRENNKYRLSDLSLIYL